MKTVELVKLEKLDLFLNSVSASLKVVPSEIEVKSSCAWVVLDIEAEQLPDLQAIRKKHYPLFM